MAKEKGGPLPVAQAAPIFNVVLPNNPYGPYQIPPLGHAAAIPPLAPAAPPALSAPLIPPGLVLGPRMDMATFCQVFNLSGTILSRLRDNAYSGTHAFPYMTGEELLTLGFKPGEIINMKEAITKWATSK